MDSCLHAAVPGCVGSLFFADLVLAVRAVIHSLLPLFFSGSLGDIFSDCLYIDRVPQPLFPLCTAQVIYKKFNTPCPFVDFAFNSTSGGVNISAMDPGGEDNPSCVPKMANLNSQVGFDACCSLSKSTCTVTATDSHPLMLESSSACCQCHLATRAWTVLV